MPEGRDPTGARAAGSRPRRVAILISGTGSNMVRLVEALQGAESPGMPVVVISNVPGAGGLLRASALGVPTDVVDHRPFGKDRAAFEDALQSALEHHAPDVLCLAGFMRVLTAAFVARWDGRILNIHPSLLPKFRGLDTHARAIAAGERTHGCTVHRVTATLDDGPVLGQAQVPVMLDDTPHGLAARVQAAEHRLYPEVLKRFLTDGDLPLVLS